MNKFSIAACRRRYYVGGPLCDGHSARRGAHTDASSVGRRPTATADKHCGSCCDVDRIYRNNSQRDACSSASFAVASHISRKNSILHVQLPCTPTQAAAAFANGSSLQHRFAVMSCGRRVCVVVEGYIGMGGLIMLLRTIGGRYRIRVAITVT